MKNIIVVGSLNKDLVSVCTRYPKLGETVKGIHYQEFNGGKGGNQAVALANLGSQVSMIAKVGKDSFGQSLIESLQEKNIDTSFVFKTNKTNTGLATILIDNHTRDNAIVVTSGANDLLVEEDINQAINLFQKSSFLVCQLEVPFKTVEYSFALAQKHNIKTVLNPSPMVDNVSEILPSCDYLIVNKTELEEITKCKVTSNDNLKEQTQLLYEKYNLDTIIITLGEQGVMAYNKDVKFIQIPAFKVQPIDTTGAGDTFAGALISNLNHGATLKDSLQFATAASALAVTKEGAQASIPTTQQVQEFLLLHSK